MTRKTYSLTELTSHIEKVFRVNFDEALWIRAEISELREKNGHCYLELIEKNDTNDTLQARIKASIWSSSYRLLKPYFEETSGQSLRPGLSILVAATVEFHPLYSISLVVKDIDPEYTLGAQARRRLEIIKQLEADGVMDMNKSLLPATLPQRIAIISSSTAAGYEDFMNQLHHHPSQFAFYTRLFPAIMQGDSASESIISALESIFEVSDRFDLVVLIRGGGATTDLACFDEYELALNCAQFPLPIVAGIGHQRDQSIVDMVVFQSVKTPTAAAEYIIDRMTKAEEKAMELYDAIIGIAEKTLNREKQRINDFRWKIKNVLYTKSREKIIELEKQKSRLKAGIQLLLAKKSNQLKIYESAIERQSPAAMMKYGYTITIQSGKRLTSVTQVKTGEPMTTIFPDGHTVSLPNEKKVLP